MDKIPQKILIIQLRRIGDIIFTLPVVGALRETFPQAEIDFLVEAPSDQFVKIYPGITQVFVYDKERSLSWIYRIHQRNYDWVLDFLSNGRTLVLSGLSGASLRSGFDGNILRKIVYNHRVSLSTQHYIVDQKLDFLRSLGYEVKKWKWELTIPKEDQAWADSFLKTHEIADRSIKLVGIAPCSRRETRRWNEDKFSEVIKTLLMQDSRVILFWGSGELEIIKSIEKKVGGGVIVPPETTLLQQSALIRRCQFVLGLDNGPRNIAVALGVPSLAIFGPTNPISINPHDDPKQQSIRNDSLFCIACGLNRCPYHHECMENLSAQSVIEKIKSMRCLSHE